MIISSWFCLIGLSTLKEGCFKDNILIFWVCLVLITLIFLQWVCVHWLKRWWDTHWGVRGHQINYSLWMKPLPFAEENPRPSPRSIPGQTSHAGYQSCPRSWYRPLALLSACAQGSCSRRRQVAAAVVVRREHLAAVARGWLETGPRSWGRFDRCWADIKSSI